MCLVGTPDERTFVKNLCYSHGIISLIELSHEVDVLAMQRAMPDDIRDEGYPYIPSECRHTLFLLKVLMVK